ncbi:MAG TPA: DUF4010 domain-containing protein [Acidobacteriaceae bacterium]|nr:DUF4010 domain-containing protein [Acidobacteriaceae bacterium]
MQAAYPGSMSIHQWLDALHSGTQSFPPTEIAIKVAVTLAIGLLIGFERQWAQKDLGVRTFSLTALLGMLSTLLTPGIAITAMVGVLLLVVMANTHALLVNRSLEGTTSVTLMVTFVLGSLVGDGHLFTPITAAILTTMLLSLKPEFTRFAGGLRPEEIRSALILGMLGFVIWPLLPNHYVDPWQLLHPRQAWITVIVVAGLSFINYVLLRLYGARGVSLTAFFGGLVNSTATAVELASSLPREGLAGQTFSAIEVTSVAMYMRNLIIVAIFARAALKIAALPLLGMAAMAMYFTMDKKQNGTTGQVELKLDSPIALRKVMHFAAIFLGIEIFGVLGTRFLGDSGITIVSAIGGLVSSASTTAAAATLAMGGKVTPQQAGIAAVVASIASALIDVPILRRQVQDKDLNRKLLLATLLQVMVGIGLVVAMTVVLRHY